MLLRSITAAMALAAISAAPAKADPSLDPLKPCYVAAQEGQTEPVTVTATGFTPLAYVEVFLDNVRQSEKAQATINGTVTGTLPAPFPEIPQRVFQLRLTQEAPPGTPAPTASTTSQVTRLSVEQVPKQARTNRRVRFRGRGFTQDLPVYAHYVYAGRARKTVNLGKPTQPCGLFSVKRKQFPFSKRPQVGVWTIQFDQQPKYDPKAAIRVPLTIKVNRTIKPQRAH
jgi:hypothetical protein